MGLRLKATVDINLHAPLSYKALADKRVNDCLNITSDGREEITRFGLKKLFQLNLGEDIKSASFYVGKKEIFYIIKAGGTLYSRKADGTIKTLLTGLNEASKHSGKDFFGRHFIALGSDGVYVTDGDKISTIGNNAPAGITVAVEAGGNLNATSRYQIGLTFYSSGYGYESGRFTSAIVDTTSTNKQIKISNIPTTATNAFIDRVRIYLRNDTTNSEFLFVTELPLGTLTYTVTANTLSTIIAPKYGTAQASQATNIGEFNGCLVLSGDSRYPTDVEVSEPYIPEAFAVGPEKKVIQAMGKGPIIGLQTGFYNNSNITPFLVICQRNSTTIYNELNGIPNQAEIDPHIGCVSPFTMQIRNGMVVFLSDRGWYSVYNGEFVRDEGGNPQTICGGDLDAKFNRPGWEREIDKGNFENFFSAYFGTNKEYITLISEGKTKRTNIAYSYNENIGGFRRYEFPQDLTCACSAVVNNQNSIIFGDSQGALYIYSASNDNIDELFDGTKKIIKTYLTPQYIIPQDLASSYNYRFLTLRLRSAREGQISIFADASLNNSNVGDFVFDTSDSASEFILDVSQLDVDSFGPESTYITRTIDLSLTGELLLLKIAQVFENGKFGLLNAQLQMNKNGNKI